RNVCKVEPIWKQRSEKLEIQEPASLGRKMRCDENGPNCPGLDAAFLPKGFVLCSAEGRARIRLIGNCLATQKRHEFTKAVEINIRGVRAPVVHSKSVVHRRSQRPRV